MFMAELSTPSVCLGKILIQVSEDDLCSCCMCMGRPEALQPSLFSPPVENVQSFWSFMAASPLLRRAQSTISW